LLLGVRSTVGGGGAPLTKILYLIEVVLLPRDANLIT